MSTPPEQPGNASASEPELSIEEQLDELLSKIEAAEPSKPDTQQTTNAPPTRPKAQPQTQAASPQTQVDALFDEAQNGEPTPAEIDALLNAPTTQADIDAMRNAPTAEAAPAEAQQDQEQDQMLASLNMALKDMPEPQADDEPAQELSMEERLQQEIMALLPPEPKASAPAAPKTSADEDDDDVLSGSFESPESLAAMESAQSATPSTQDQIAMEIESLLATEQKPNATAQSSDTAIDELDQMLAQEIDDDDDLAGDFHSVEDLTAGIQVDDRAQATDDEHAATARDVAAELDSQPEDLPAPPSAESSEDPFKELDEIVGKSRQDQAQPQRRAALQADDLKDWLQTAKERLLVGCYWINWPARRFLTAEWRANLGYIALLNLFFGVGIWVVRILF